MSRHPRISSVLGSPRNLRLGALILVFIAINQVDDPLVDPTIGQELLYWTVRVSVLAIGLWTADLLVSRRLAGRLEYPAWLKPAVIASVIGILPFALAEILIEPHLPMRPEYRDDELWAFSPFLAFLSEYATAISILIPVHLVLWLVIERRGESSAASTPPEDPPLPDFLQRSSVRIAGDVQALQAEEHYIRIYTREGAELVHYRFGDAIAEMPQALGLQVHRSWWVAESAVRSAKRGSRRWQLQLDSGVSVPVSDSYVSAVRERGWLKRKRTVS